MKTYKLKDFVVPIAISVTDPANSGYDKFVGLEHYDSGELVVSRYSGVELLTTTAKAFIAKDILVARRNVYLRRAGVVNFDGITSGDSIVLRVREDCEKVTGVSRELAQSVLPLVVNSDAFWAYANKHADGMNSKRVSKDTLMDYEFDLPSLDEQKVLADKLWAAYRVKESYRKLLAATDDMVKAKFVEMFGDGEKNCIWKDVVSITNGKAYKGEYQKSGTYPIYGSGGIMAYGEEKMCEGGTIILGRKGNINTPIFVKEDYWIVDTAFCLSVDKLRLDATYFYHWCMYFDFMVYNKQGVLPSLTKTDLEGINMYLPPIDLQHQFADIATQAEATKTSLRQSIESIDRVIKSLINQ